MPDELTAAAVEAGNNYSRRTEITVRDAFALRGLPVSTGQQQIVDTCVRSAFVAGAIWAAAHRRAMDGADTAVMQG